MGTGHLNSGPHAHTASTPTRRAVSPAPGFPFLPSQKPIQVKNIPPSPPGLPLAECYGQLYHHIIPPGVSSPVEKTASSRSRTPRHPSLSPWLPSSQEPWMTLHHGNNRSRHEKAILPCGSQKAEEKRGKGGDKVHPSKTRPSDLLPLTRLYLCLPPPQ